MRLTFCVVLQIGLLFIGSNMKVAATETLLPDNKNAEALRSWNISYRNIPRLTTVCLRMQTKSQGRHMSFLRRSADGNNVAAILHVPGVYLIFNPSTESLDYGPLPKMLDLTPEQANLIFAENPSTAVPALPSGSCSYNLFEQSSAKPHATILDLKFYLGKCQKFRIHSPNEKPGEWFSVR
jgi:hypothetical protein